MTERKKTMYCPNCGAKIESEAEICPKCGVRIKAPPMPPAPPAPMKNSGLAAVLSFFVVGLGQIYNGQIGKGIILIILYAVSWAACWVLIGFPMLIVLWIYGVYDAYKTAEKINAGQIV